MYKSIFNISKMDCPSEENLIRMSLEGISSIISLKFNIDKRELIIIYEGEISKIQNRIHSLNLGESIIKTIEIEKDVLFEADNFNNESNKAKQRLALKLVLIINFAFFLIEITIGLFSNSMGLVADGLDMLADAFVYGMSLLVVGLSVISKKRVALFSGYIQIFLAIFGFIEVLRRFVFSDFVPDYKLMIIISILALIANVLSLFILKRLDSQEAHIKASVIFSSNDIIINMGVILAGVLVFVYNNLIPDLIIGGITFALVFYGAIRILKLGK
ncbi:MAG: cation transporter [Bacteroidales bacterium]|nr:cation transporter [Bacteroidales bacterium]